MSREDSMNVLQNPQVQAALKVIGILVEARVHKDSPFVLGYTMVDEDNGTHMNLHIEASILTDEEVIAKGKEAEARGGHMYTEEEQTKDGWEL